MGSGDDGETSVPPNEFLEFIIKKAVGWSDAENKLTDYLIKWAVATCNATNKTS